MAVFQRVSETDEASRVDVYRAVRRRRSDGSVYWRVVYTRSWQGPFPLVDAPVVAQDATPPESELLAPEATTSEVVASEVTPVTSEVAASEAVTASEATTTLSPDRNSCEDCGKFVDAVAEYTCHGVAEIGCGLVCFEPDLYVDLDSCEPQCGAVIAAVCAAGVPANQDPACSPFCYHEELTGDELVSVAREKALSQDMREVGPGVDWSAGMQVGPVSEDCTQRNEDNVCMTFICHNPTAGCSSRWDGDDIRIAPGSTAIKAVRHQCTDGNVLLTISYAFSNDTIVYYYEWEKPAQNDTPKTQAERRKLDREGERLLLEDWSANGERAVRRNQAQETFSATSVQYPSDPSETCDGCGTGGNEYQETASCDDLGLGCFGTACGFCLIACATPATLACAACAIGCPYAGLNEEFGCCRDQGTYCRKCAGLYG